MTDLYLSLGSNLGDRKQMLHRAITLIDERIGTVQRISSFIETEPWGFQSPHPFLNAAVHLQTSLTPQQLLAETQAIERLLGRTHKTPPVVNALPIDDQGVVSVFPADTPLPAYADRPIDIDILLYGDLRISTPELTIPHPLMHLRDFVLRPLGEIMEK